MNTNTASTIIAGNTIVRSPKIFRGELMNYGIYIVRATINFDRSKAKDAGARKNSHII